MFQVCSELEKCLPGSQPTMDLSLVDSRWCQGYSCALDSMYSNVSLTERHGRTSTSHDHVLKSPPVFPEFFAPTFKPSAQTDSKLVTSRKCSPPPRQSDQMTVSPPATNQLPAFYHPSPVELEHAAQPCGSSPPCSIPQPRHPPNQDFSIFNTSLSLTPPDSETDTASLFDEFFPDTSGDVPDLVIDDDQPADLSLKPRPADGRLEVTFDSMSPQVIDDPENQDLLEGLTARASPVVTATLVTDNTAAFNGYHKDEAVLPHSVDTQGSLAISGIKKECEELPSCSFSQPPSRSGILDMVDIKPSAVELASVVGYGPLQVTRPSFLPLEISPAPAACLSSAFPPRTAYNMPLPAPLPAHAQDSYHRPCMAALPALMTPPGIALPFLPTSSSFQLTPPGSQPSSPDCLTQTAADGLRRHTPPPPYPGRMPLTSLPLLSGATPFQVVTKPRQTHPGCSTIRYNRKNNPELEKRRVHFCNYMGEYL